MTKEDLAKRICEQIQAVSDDFTGAVTFRVDFNNGGVRKAQKVVEESVK